MPLELTTEDVSIPDNKVEKKINNTTPKRRKKQSKKPGIQNNKLTSYLNSTSVVDSKLDKTEISEKSLKDDKKRETKEKCISSGNAHHVKQKDTKVTDYFYVRRSERRPKGSVIKEKAENLEECIIAADESQIEVCEIEGKGRGVIAGRAFSRGEFVVEYAGELIKISEAKRREKKYGDDPSIGCYMYYFMHGGRGYCVDATAETDRLGRLVNHSRKGSNCCTRAVAVAGVPRLVLIASRDIAKGEELSYDYGDRSKSSVDSHPWLAS